MSAPESVFGSLLVCRVDSQWNHRQRLYLAPNDPPERVMREEQWRTWWGGEGEGAKGKTAAVRAKDEIWTKDKQRTHKEKMTETQDWAGRINIRPCTRVFIDRELSFLIGKCLKPNRGKEQKAAWKQEQDNCSLWPSTILHLVLPTAYHQQFDVCFSVIVCDILNENEVRWSMQLNLQFMVCSIIRQWSDFPSLH